MRRDGLLKALARLSVETGSLACLGCGHEHNCAIHGCAILRAAKEALIRPVSREQVEKVWRGEWIHKRSPYDYKIFVCKKCGKQISIQGENMDFCPACGAAQTDEAVDILLKRLEALKDGKGD